MYDAGLFFLDHARQRLGSLGGLQLAHERRHRHMDHGARTCAVLSMIEYEYPFGIRLFPRCVGLGRRERKKEETLG